jgi:MAF protein
MPRPLLLASSSPARRQLLERLRLPFACASPDVDESALPGETAAALAARLSRAKAAALAASHPEHLIIGSDQALDVDGDILGKPGDFEGARRQLQRLSGRVVTFHTGLCLLDSSSDHCQLTVEPYEVSFRDLDDATIERYLRAEEPYGCAGSFKSEGLGICLFRRFSGRDPNSLVGLPLMALADFLRNEGFCLP